MKVDDIVKKSASRKDGLATFTAHVALLALHTKALACHCECLGMNAENCAAACIDSRPPFDQVNYQLVMQKWGLINEKGEPII